MEVNSAPMLTYIYKPRMIEEDTKLKTVKSHFEDYNENFAEMHMSKPTKNYNKNIGGKPLYMNKPTKNYEKLEHDIKMMAHKMSRTIRQISRIMRRLRLNRL